VTILEGGGKTPWTAPDELASLGFSMILYPTTVLFRITRTIQRALADLRSGRQMPENQAVSMIEMEKILDIAYWKSVEQQALPMSERFRQGINRLFKRIA
jgi:2-methylisocitrate lyase-like PEP mutase family enzyme